MHLLVLVIFGKYCIRHIFCVDISRLFQYFNNISDRFQNILAILQYFQEYFYNIVQLFRSYAGTFLCEPKFVFKKLILNLNCSLDLRKNNEAVCKFN